MAAPSSCPPADRLRQLLVETPADADQAELIAHLDHCDACRRMLDSLAGAGPALLQAAGALRLNAYAEETSLRRVLESLEEDPGRSTFPDARDRTTWVQSLLEPPESGETLGRLAGYEVT